MIKLSIVDDDNFKIHLLEKKYDEQFTILCYCEYNLVELFPGDIANIIHGYVDGNITILCTLYHPTYADYGQYFRLYMIFKIYNKIFTFEIEIFYNVSVKVYTKDYGDNLLFLYNNIMKYFYNEEKYIKNVLKAYSFMEYTFYYYKGILTVKPVCIIPKLIKKYKLLLIDKNKADNMLSNIQLIKLLTEMVVNVIRNNIDITKKPKTIFNKLKKSNDYNIGVMPVYIH